MDHQAFVMQSHGGVSRIFTEIARHFPKDKLNLKVFGGLHINAHIQSLQSSNPSLAVGLRVPSLIGKQRLLMPCNRVLLSIFRSLQHPDLVHYTYFRRTQKRRLNTREVMTVHDMIYELSPESFQHGDPTPERKRVMANEVDGIICVSENTKTDLLRFCDVPDDRVKVIPHGNPMEGVVPKRPNNAPHPFILFVGKRGGYKNFSTLLNALSTSNACNHLNIIAFGGEAFSDQERAEIHQKGLCSRVSHMTGSDEVLAGYYETARVLVYPSRYEGFGLPPLEAMSLGCPVIVSKGSSLPEVVGTAGLYFNPDCEQELRAHIESLNQNEIRSQLRALGLSRARLFSWARCANETADFYKEVLARPPRTRE
jgi:glycosyltransferase involved in cell wall biosynthesis